MGSQTPRSVIEAAGRTRPRPVEIMEALDQIAKGGGDPRDFLRGAAVPRATRNRWLRIWHNPDARRRLEEGESLRAVCGSAKSGGEGESAPPSHSRPTLGQVLARQRAAGPPDSAAILLDAAIAVGGDHAAAAWLRGADAELRRSGASAAARLALAAWALTVVAALPDEVAEAVDLVLTTPDPDASDEARVLATAVTRALLVGTRCADADEALAHAASALRRLGPGGERLADGLAEAGTTDALSDLWDSREAV